VKAPIGVLESAAFGSVPGAGEEMAGEGLSFPATGQHRRDLLLMSGVINGSTHEVKWSIWA